MPKRIIATVFAIISCVNVPGAALAACQVEGVWEQVSVKWDGKELPAHSRPLEKIVFRGHWIELGAEAHREKLPQQTEVDKLRAMQTFGGAGTYTTTASTFTQHIESFSIPGAEGATLTAMPHRR